MKVAEKPTAKAQLDDIILDVSWADISKTYFGKSSSWIYNKLNGRDGNGGHGEFNEQETEVLRNALFELSDRIRKCAEKLV
ncbi:DUF5053 domain-containing protein [Flavobacterium branchiophilum NBRC 15030 = ATCC 35035]|uniref:Uncharacterized protein DUF5053 n=1 Tax=Flavobacterium branchiophilum TaxID=55197 RepID=A0A543G120_9FLAO|nr:DUF5053 domain-containing protein [Flavobacterium branchiophilum]OXA81211.1 DUF5053 domain-containing protein [Flavobacterium branchiophilum NBRC 15030 = ATCC 35035]TQM39761.1 uncharacterized protein DUF5053 [Flavobacterium branchiophilum]GEM55200.1 hypothetical protein FB1_14210 [Flavobacterium branchiophilum NBRC 15030 = ATCC 35035]